MATPDQTQIDELTARLTEVQAAISAVLAGAQEYTIGGQRIHRADLNQLMQLEKTIQGRLNNLLYPTRAYAKWTKR